MQGRLRDARAETESRRGKTYFVLCFLHAAAREREGEVLGSVTKVIILTTKRSTETQTW